MTMAQVSALAPLVATQDRVAGRNPSTATVAAQVAERTERVRLAVFGNAEHGLPQRVCSAMDWRKERHSREQNGHDRLTVELVFADVLVHEADGNPDKAAQILAAFQRPLCPVLRMRDGQYLLEFV